MEVSHHFLQNPNQPPLERKYPPDSPYNTIKENKLINLFEDSEILTVHSTVRSEMKDSVLIEYGQNGKAIIQQQARRGCSAAVEAMLLLDHDKKCDLKALKWRHLSTAEEMCNHLNSAELIASIISLPLKRTPYPHMERLEEQIKDNPTIVTLKSELGLHAVIVEEISSFSVRIRDPYHGWEISVKKEAFLKRFPGGEVIQISPS